MGMVAVIKIAHQETEIQTIIESAFPRFLEKIFVLSGSIEPFESLEKSMLMPAPVLSIITTVYNQLAMNRMFVAFLKKFTRTPYELIVVDNGSTDGSVEYFSSVGARIIRNSGNYSYPYCQNRGAEQAVGEYLAFANNDIIVSPRWDERVRLVMTTHGLDVAACCATDRMENDERTRKQQWKWRWVREPLSCISTSEKMLQRMHRLMYGDWEKYSERRFAKFGTNVKEGIAGCNVIFTRRGWELLKPWDERINAGDFDVFLRAKERQQRFGDIKPPHLLLGIYFHHFIRLTARQSYPPYADKAKLIRLEEKWEKTYVNELLKETDMRI
jgi:glycosyltransferase involved in cell wall biosynthesis